MMEASGSERQQPVCQICDTNLSKYVCPRCGVPYCSLPCYKNEAKHLQCSESFYRDCVVESIKTEEDQNPENAKKMKEVLQRFHEQYNVKEEDKEEEEELDSDDDEPLEKRLAGVDLNDAEEVWKHLSSDERQEFKALIQNVDSAGDIIPEWIPWWEERPEKKLVEDVSESHTNQGSEPVSSMLKVHKRQPDYLNPIPKMRDLTKVTPNEHVAKGLINVITAYVWTARLFNGDLFDASKITEVASSIIYLSSFLNKDGVFRSIEQSIADVPMNACQVPVLSDGGTSIQTGLNRDIWKIVKGPECANTSSALVSKTYLLSALTECYTVFKQVSKILKASPPDKKENTEGEDISKNSFSKLFPTPPPILSVDLKIVNKAKRKLFYLLAYANEFIDDINVCA